MIGKINSNSNIFKYNSLVNNQRSINYGTTLDNSVQFSNPSFLAASNPIVKQTVVNQPSTTLSAKDNEKYVALASFLQNAPISPNSEGVSATKQLDILLKNGKLLAKSSHDNSTVLDNLYQIATTDRAYNLDKTVLLTSTLDLLCNPRYVTQTFGDIPQDIQKTIVEKLPQGDETKQNPEKMNVYASGTCAAASIEVTMADKYPAEFARWVNGLSSTKKSVDLHVNLKSISKSPLEAISILNLLEAHQGKFNYSKADVKVGIDEKAFARAFVQSKYWNKGERNVADVLIQSAIMGLGSQHTYNALTDVRAGRFSSNPQGLIELEKTFVESLIKNKEITSLIYHNIDENQNLIGYNCSLDKISKHLTDTIDQGDNVILGYILTNETAGVSSQPSYNPVSDGPKNRVINGHEITVIDYYKDEKGKTVFVCVDTDDNSPELVQYSADWLLPKVHHAGYPAHIVAADEKDIMKNVLGN
ncbi:MAG: hypothetical protein IJW73_06120 [Candidatus Gastranaerophilales bacterium]|nr:hypothetical protein [Candidatus Gastranaerophilales bacterium]